MKLPLRNNQRSRKVKKTSILLRIVKMRTITAATVKKVSLNFSRTPTRWVSQNLKRAKAKKRSLGVESISTSKTRPRATAKTLAVKRKISLQTRSTRKRKGLRRRVTSGRKWMNKSIPPQSGVWTWLTRWMMSRRFWERRLHLTKRRRKDIRRLILSISLPVSLTSTW